MISGGDHIFLTPLYVASVSNKYANICTENPKRKVWIVSEKNRIT